MSLILDALRKSEAERRRGQSPDLFASPPVAGAPRPGPWPRVVSLLLLVALALTATFVLWPHRQVIIATAAENPSGQEQSMDADARSGVGHLAFAATDTAPAIANPPASTRPSLVAPGLDPTAGDSNQLAAKGLAAQTSASSSAAIQTSALAPTSARAPASATATARTLLPTTAAAIAIPRAGTGSTPILAASTQSTPLSTSSAPAPDDDDSPGEALPPIAVLAASERAALPPLKLSMHVWNSEPRKRFAIIDGQRVTEGSTLGAGVIEEIRRDGVVLNINGRRVLLPRP